MVLKNNRILIEHRRWMILYFLNSATDYSLNSDIIKLLFQTHAVPIDVEEVQDDLELLESRGCVILDRFVLAPGVKLWAVRMTKAGKEVYDGVRHVYGVKQNGPLR